MTQVYSNPEREHEPHALPNIEVFYIDQFDADQNARLNDNGTNDFVDYVVADKAGWYWWACFPGCIPDSDPCGPFGTEAEATEDAQDC